MKRLIPALTSIIPLLAASQDSLRVNIQGLPDFNPVRAQKPAKSKRKCGPAHDRRQARKRAAVKRARRLGHA